MKPYTDDPRRTDLRDDYAQHPRVWRRYRRGKAKAARRAARAAAWSAAHRKAEQEKGGEG